jgi:hypothetical protein
LVQLELQALAAHREITVPKVRLGQQGFLEIKEIADTLDFLAKSEEKESLDQQQEK